MLECCCRKLKKSPKCQRTVGYPSTSWASCLVSLILGDTNVFLRYIVIHQGATLQRPHQIRHFIRHYIQSSQGDSATALTKFALSECSCYVMQSCYVTLLSSKRCIYSVQIRVAGQQHGHQLSAERTALPRTEHQFTVDVRLRWKTTSFEAQALSRQLTIYEPNFSDDFCAAVDLNTEKYNPYRTYEDQYNDRRLRHEVLVLTRSLAVADRLRDASCR